MAESAELLREAAEQSLELAAEHRQALEMAAFPAVQFIPGVDEAGLLIDEAIEAGEDAAEAEEDVEEAAASCGGQSFSASTKVLLAFGCRGADRGSQSWGEGLGDRHEDGEVPDGDVHPGSGPS